MPVYLPSDHRRMGIFWGGTTNLGGDGAVPVLVEELEGLLELGHLLLAQALGRGRCHLLLISPFYSLSTFFPWK